MKVFLILSALVAVALAEIEYYRTENDYLDADKVMQDPELVKSYVACYIDQGPCNSLTHSYKIIMHDSLVHNCERCNPAQKHLWYRFLWNLANYYPQEYAAFKGYYDPEGVLIPALLKVVSSY